MTDQRLSRELGILGATVTGLGSILGTGAFVAIGVAAGMWGDAVFWAIPLAGIVAVFNGLSSAFLAGRFPIAGGTYEYAYQTLGPWFGFAAGWLFLAAKTASAASAALGISGYLGTTSPVVPVAAVAAVTGLVLAGIRRTTGVNIALVLATIAAIVWFSLSGVGEGAAFAGMNTDAAGLLPAIAFLFVAYTGYGRIATLGEEVKNPERDIPRAVVLTLGVAVVLYMAIEIGGRARGGPFWGETIDMAGLGLPLVTVGAVTAMLGVLLNLVLGLSRVWLAMGRRGDMPARLGRLDRRVQPVAAIVLSGALSAAVTLVGDISIAWSFSAMMVLLYYGITNLAALHVNRRRITAWAGLASCLLLSFFVPFPIWLTGTGLIALGFAWNLLYRRLR